MKIRKLMAGLLAATIFITTGTCFVVNATDVVDDGLAWESCNPMDENISESKKTQELESDDSLDDEISKGLIEINIEELSNYCVGYEEIEPDPLSYEETTRLDVSPGTYGMNAIGTGAMELQAQISYTPSDAYKNSVYYTRLTNVVLTGDARTDLVNIALSQEGYHEGNSSSDLGGGNSSGSGNYTEYGAWRKVNGQSWCAIFIGWCAAQASIPKSVINNQGTFATTDDMGVTWHSSTSDYKPQVGDLFIWDTRGYHESGKGEHIGIIYKVDSSKIYTIEGNSSNQVKKNSYSLSNSNIAGYGSYDGTSVIYPGKTTVTVSVVGSSVTVNWNAVVNATSYDVYLVQSPWGWNNTDLKYRREGLTTTSYTFTGVEDGYYAAFVVTRPNDNSVQSDWVYFTVVPNTTLTYNANGGNGTMNAITLTFNQPFTSKSCAFTRTGYTFEGWNLKRDADNKWFVYGIGWETEAEMANNGHTKQVYNDPFNLTYDGSFLNGYSGNSTFTVYAVWRPQTYTISYNPNGGTGNMNSVTVAFEEQFSLPACTFKKTGYSCIGWNLKRDADNKWFASGVGWETEAEITSNGHTKNNYGDPFGLELVDRV